MPRFALPLRALITIAATVTISGCFYSPTGTNVSTELYPVPDGNKVTLEWTPPKGVEPTSVTFVLEPPEGEEASSSSVQDVDDETKEAGEPYVGELDVTGLSPGIHFVAVFLDEDEEPTSRIAFAIPDPELASDEEPAEEEEEAATDEEAEE